MQQNATQRTASYNVTPRNTQHHEIYHHAAIDNIPPYSATSYVSKLNISECQALQRHVLLRHVNSRNDKRQSAPRKCKPQRTTPCQFSKRESTLQCHVTQGLVHFAGFAPRNHMLLHEMSGYATQHDSAQRNLTLRHAMKRNAFNCTAPSTPRT